MSKRNPTLIIGGLVVAVALFTVVLWIAQTMTSPAPLAGDKLASIPTDGKVGVVAQITAIQGNTLTIEILQGKEYAERSGMLLQAERGKDQVTLGDETDIKIGTIAQFNGVKTSANKMQLVRITILTGYYKGPPAK